MTKPKKIIAIVAAALVGLVALAALALVLIVHSESFRGYVRGKVISSVEDSTGGKVDLKTFSFDLRRGAEITGFVIHGTEPPSSAPLFEASAIVLRMRLFPKWDKLFELDYLGIQQPSATILVFPNGQTNIPKPKTKSSGNGLTTVVNLAIRDFEIRDGSVQYLDQKIPFSARGQNLRAQLNYNSAKPSYQGRVSMDPLYLASGTRPPLRAKVVIPLVFEKDKIGIAYATIETPRSRLAVNGTMQNLNSPVISTNASAHVALDELIQSFDLPIHLQRNGPAALDLDAGVRMDHGAIQIEHAKVGLGRSRLELAGALRDSSGKSSAGFRGNLSLDELGQLLQLSARPRGDVNIAGQARFTSTADYQVSGNINARALSFMAGNSHMAGIGIASSFNIDPKTIAVNSLKVSALGGEITADARVHDLAAFTFNGNLRGLHLQSLATAAGSTQALYGGILSGPIEARGNLKSPGITGIDASSRLAIVPAGPGMPVSGQINIDYDGARDAIAIDHSELSLPHTRIDLSGIIGQRAEIQVVSRNLNDFLPVMALTSPSIRELPITLTGGSANLSADINGPLKAPQIASHLSVTNFEAGERRFDKLTADLAASPSGVNLQNGALSHKSLQASFSGSIGLSDWKVTPIRPLAANASIRNGDLADVLALAGESEVPASGALNFDARIAGTLGNPQGAVNLAVMNGSAYEEAFDRIQVTAALTDRRVDLTSAELSARAGRIELRGVFNHPRDSFTTGQIQLHAGSSQIELSDLKALQVRRPGFGGAVNLDVDLAGNLQDAAGKIAFTPSIVNANLRAMSLRDQHQNYGNLTATARTNSSDLNIRLDSDFAGSSIVLTSQTELAHDYATTLDANVRGLSIEKVLLLAALSDTQARGTLSLAAHATGTLSDPRANVSFNLARAVVYNEPLDQVEGTIAYTNQLVNISGLRLASPAGQIELAGSFSHPASNSLTDIRAGHIDLNLKNSRIDLGRVQYVKKIKPGLTGTAQVAADASADLSQRNGERRILFSRLNVNGGVTGIELNRQALGGVTFKSETKGNDLSFNLDSDLGKSSIHGSGQWRLRPDYPIDAKLTFANVTYSGLKGLFETAEARPGFDGLLEGQIEVAGSASQLKNLRGDLQVSRLELSTIQPGANTNVVALQNQGPIAARLENSSIQIESFHLTGRNTDIALKGSLAFDRQSPLDFTVAANTDLALLKDFNRDIYSGGTVVLDGAIRGALAHPQVNGKLELKNASVNLAGWPNGISNASGVILLSGANASIQSLTAESGGGKVSLSGFAGFNGTTMTYEIRGNASHVRSRYQGASVVTSASVTLTGTSERSVLGGDVTIERVGYGAQTDFGSMLYGSSSPPEASSASTGALAGMRLNVRIQTAPDVRFETSLAEGLQASANLTLRGTLANPGLVGRVNITAGTLVFFGNKYTVNRGAISFFNQFSIEPVLDVDLETTAQGVDVVLTISGPINDLKMTYTSDPPLKFDDIIALLATGRTPPDPTIAAHQPESTQSVSQMGESAIIGQAVASPVASRLQRVFGVSQLKINPTFDPGSSVPTARVTLQQQVTPEITFTYTQDLSQSNSEILRVEWALTPRFSAVAVRDANGIFGIDFFYKKKFR